MIKIIRLLGFICAVVGGGYVSSAHALSDYYDTYTISSTAGSTINVDIRVSEFSTDGEPSVSAYDLGIIFDPNYLNLEEADIHFSNELNISGFGSLIGVTPGISVGNLTEFRIAETSLDSEETINHLQSGDFILFSLSFSGVQTGVSPIKLEVYDWLDAASNPTGIQLGNQLALESVNIQAVPEPMTFWLISIGMLYFFRKNCLILNSILILKERLL